VSDEIRLTNDELPEGWVSCSLGDAIGYVRNGMVAKQTKDGVGLPISRIETIAAGTIDPNRIGYSNDVPAKNAESYRLKSGDILFSHINSPSHLGKTAIYEGRPETLYHGMNLLMIQARQGIAISRYLEAALRFLRVSGTFSLVAQHAVNQASINQRRLSELEIPLAPLPEQKRIADKLEAVLGRVDACRVRLDRVPALLKRFRQSVLAAATSGRLTEDWRGGNGVAGNWQKRVLTELGELGRGKSKHRPRGDKRLYDGSYPFVQTGDVANSGGLITHHSQTYSEFGLAQSKLWPKGTVCITIAANIADTAILAYPACFPDSVVGFVADPTVCFPQFIKWSIDVIKDDLEKFAPATAQKNINLGVLYEIKIGCPALSEQAEIVRRVEALFALADRIEDRLAAAQATVARLTPATLAKAFRGELVPQNPDDEPAAALLERTRRQTTAKPGREIRKHRVHRSSERQ